MRDIGKNIRALRIKKNMTQDELAERLFVTRQTVSNYETGKSRPDIDMLVKMSETLDCDVNTLLYGIPALEDRTKEFRSFLVGLVACAISGFPLLFWERAQQMRQMYHTGPKLTLQMLVLPLFLLVLGWTLMQGICFLTKARPLAFKHNKLVFWFIVMIAMVYFSSVLPLIFHEIKVCLVREYISGLSTSKGWAAGFDYGSVFMNMLTGKIHLFMYKKQWLFLLLGVFLCLFKRPKLNKKHMLALPCLTLALGLLLFMLGNSEFILRVPKPEELTDVPYGIQVEQWVDENSWTEE